MQSEVLLCQRIELITKVPFFAACQPEMLQLLILRLEDRIGLGSLLRAHLLVSRALDAPGDQACVAACAAEIQALIGADASVLKKVHSLVLCERAAGQT